MADMMRPPILSPQFVPVGKLRSVRGSTVFPGQPNDHSDQPISAGKCEGANQSSLPPPVPHESMKNSSATPDLSTTFLKTASAVGLRQILPASQNKLVAWQACLLTCTTNCFKDATDKLLRGQVGTDCSPRHTKSTLLFVISGASAVADYAPTQFHQQHTAVVQYAERKHVRYLARGLIRSPCDTESC